MKRNTFDDSRDQQAASRFDDDRHLYCGAHGCPCRWSVDAGNGQLCSAHAWAEKEEWPRITDEQVHAVADAAMRRAMPPKPAPRLTREQKTALLQRLRLAVNAKPINPRAWIGELRQREEAGEVLTLHQRQSWREAARRTGMEVQDDAPPTSAAVALPLPSQLPPAMAAALDPEAEYDAAAGEPMPWPDDMPPPAMYADRMAAANRSAA